MENQPQMALMELIKYMHITHSLEKSSYITQNLKKIANLKRHIAMYQSLYGSYLVMIRNVN